MEFPHIGKNCSFGFCNRLDFLPVKCDACQKSFCSDHFSYVKHQCSASTSRDVQVPQCPLCGALVPGNRGEPPDVAVGAHIDNQCTSDPARERRKKVFTNRCAYKGCKTKEMVPLVCAECTANFCLRHRHTVDHACGGRMEAKRLQAVNAAMARMKASQVSRMANPPPSAHAIATPVAAFSNVQGDMTEDEALAHALALSLQDTSLNGRERDRIMARGLARPRVGGDQNSRCSVS